MTRARRFAREAGLFLAALAVSLLLVLLWLVIWLMRQLGRLREQLRELRGRVAQLEFSARQHTDHLRFLDSNVAPRGHVHHRLYPEP